MGALTNKPYAFSARPWELKTIESIDLFDALGSSIQVSIKDHTIVRILPRINHEINFEWITDKVRFFYDSLSRRRIMYPFLKYKGYFLKINFKFLNQYIFLLASLHENKVRTIYNLGPFSDISLATFARDISFLERDTFAINGYEEERIVDDYNSNYLMKVSFSNIQEKDSFLFCGVNPRLEMPLLDLRVRNIMRQRMLYVFTFGVSFSLLYPFFSLGALPCNLISFFAAKTKLAFFLHEKVINIFVGLALYQRKDFISLRNLIEKFANITLKRSNINFVSVKASSTGIYDIGFKKSFFKNDFLKNRVIMYSIALNQSKNVRKKNIFNFVFSHHATKVATSSDLVIPINSIFEQTGVFINLEGRGNIARKVFRSALSKMYDITRLIEHFWNIKHRGLFFVRNKYKKNNSKFIDYRYNFLFKKLSIIIF